MRKSPMRVQLANNVKRRKLLLLGVISFSAVLKAFYALSRDIFESGPDANGYIQYAVDFGPMRMVVCDTLEGPNHGDYDEVRAAWLAETLHG